MATAITPKMRFTGTRHHSPGSVRVIFENDEEEGCECFVVYENVNWFWPDRPNLFQLRTEAESRYPDGIEAWERCICVKPEMSTTYLECMETVDPVIYDPPRMPERIRVSGFNSEVQGFCDYDWNDPDTIDEVAASISGHDEHGMYPTWVSWEIQFRMVHCNTANILSHGVNLFGEPAVDTTEPYCPQAWFPGGDNALVWDFGDCPDRGLTCTLHGRHDFNGWTMGVYLLYVTSSPSDYYGVFYVLSEYYASGSNIDDPVTAFGVYTRYYLHEGASLPIDPRRPVVARRQELSIWYALSSPLENLQDEYPDFVERWQTLFGELFPEEIYIEPIA